MALIQKNIWLLYFSLVIFGFFFSLYNLKEAYQGIQDELIEEQESRIQLVNISLNSLLRQQEQILDLMGNYLLDVNEERVPATVSPLFDDVLEDNPSLAGLALLSPEGEFLYISSNVNRDTLENLFSDPEMGREAFLYTMEQEKMVLGRTQYFEPVQEVILPLSKALRDEKGRVYAVLIIAMKLRTTSEFFSENLHMTEHDVLYFIRDFDGYVQYRSSRIELEKSYYLDPIPKEVLDKGFEALSDKYGKDRNAFKQSGDIYSLKGEDRWGKKVSSSFLYNRRYELWVISDFHMSAFREQFNPVLIRTTIIFLLFSGLLYVLTRTIYRAEKKKQAALIRQANYDLLTGLPNRNFLNGVSPKWFKGGAPPFALFLIDVDHFKHVNYSFGQGLGDQLLIEIATRLKDAAGDKSLILRPGDAGFYVLTPLKEKGERSLALKEEGTRLHDSITDTYVLNGFHLFVSASLGASCFPDHGENWKDLFRSAGIALKEAKKSRNECQLFSREMEKEYLRRTAIQYEIKRGLEAREFYAVYQPQVDRSGKVCGAESLARWENPRLGAVSPSEFIEVAEASGMIGEIGEYMLSHVFDTVRDMRKEIGEELNFSVNVSVKQFMRGDFVDTLTEMIESYGMSRISLTLEITENLFIEDLEYLLPLLEKIHAMGIRISMDDFGTGYSSLGIVGKLPIDEIKIDKSFVDSILENEKDLQMIKNIISIGNNQGCTIVAEGVERREQADLLYKLGCHNIQGYYYSRPLGKEDFVKYIKKQEKSSLSS
ncbi:MAG: EAL domain-containing protein [Spirochaetales bacterium]|nr:EAL domain-containing protein [Spirochaetales bacterium]